ncbi:MAG: DUF3098 domain-containing protein [Bacteroidales bacterium]|jgi:hypothetical protein|nr:DUF3098 domain-containing protein [Bacteroidales bacterium]
MVNMITNKKENSTKSEASTKAPLFQKLNYILMGIGVVLLFLGYILLSGGKAPSNDVFSETIFDARHLVVAPSLMLLGIVVEIFGIMYHPKAK